MVMVIEWLYNTEPSSQTVYDKYYFFMAKIL